MDSAVKDLIQNLSDSFASKILRHDFINVNDIWVIRKGKTCLCRNFFERNIQLVLLQAYRNDSFQKRNRFVVYKDFCGRTHRKHEHQTDAIPESETIFHNL